MILLLQLYWAEIKMALFYIVTVLVYTGTKSEKYWSFHFYKSSCHDSLILH